MLVYTQIEGESPPEAFVLSGPDATVEELLERVTAARSARGREMKLLLDNAGGQRLRDLGIGEGALIGVAGQGEPKVETAAPREAAPAEEPGPAVRPAPGRGGRRLSEYEELTQLLQWHAPYHINADRPSHQVWTDDSTSLRSTDWEAFRTPDKLYYRTYTAAQAKAERAVQEAFEFAQEAGQIRQVDAGHVDFMRNIIGALQYPDWGLCVLHQHTTRFALSSWIAGATEFMMFDELRHAQLYGRLTLAYEEAHGGFGNGNALWMEHPRFQPTRRLIEELISVLDWGQGLVVAGVLVEPVLTSVAHAVLRDGSIRAGDTLSTFACQSMARDKRRHRESASAFLDMVCSDATFGPANREKVSGWAADWLPRARHAALALADDHPAAGDAMAGAITWISDQLQHTGVETDLVSTAHHGGQRR
jgi:hypothetical protein